MEVGSNEEGAGMTTGHGSAGAEDLGQLKRASRALRWVRENSAVRQAAISAASAPGLALPDALLVDPSRVLAAAQAALSSATDHRAPSDVVDVLSGVVSRYQAGLDRASELAYTQGVLQSLQGFRDRFEIEGPLQKAANDAPTELDRQKLTDLLANVRQPRSFDPEFPPEDEATHGSITPQLRRQGCDWGCCAFTCVLCAEGCILCCVAACFLC